MFLLLLFWAWFGYFEEAVYSDGTECKRYSKFKRVQ